MKTALDGEDLTEMIAIAYYLDLTPRIKKVWDFDNYPGIMEAISNRNHNVIEAICKGYLSARFHRSMITEHPAPSHLPTQRYYVSANIYSDLPDEGWVQWNSAALSVALLVTLLLGLELK